MSTNKNIRPAFLWRPALVIIAIAFGLLVIFFTWQYFVNRPNYRDLRREYSKLVLPSDWQLISESGNKGAWGLFCWGIDDSSCPYINSNYSRAAIDSKTPDQIIDAMQAVITKNGYTLIKGTYQKCSQNEIQNENYACGATGYKDSVELHVSIDSTDSKGNKGNWAGLFLSKHEK
jgi:hypothetical protein